MEPKLSAVQLETTEFIARFVHERMLRVPEPFYGVSLPVFDNECTSAYEWTTGILSDVGLMKTFDERPYSFYVFTCDPESFNHRIRSNAKHLPSEQNCLSWLVSFAEQSGEIDREPFFSFLNRLGIVAPAIASEHPDFEPIAEAVLEMMGIENNSANLEKLTTDMRAAAKQSPQIDFEFTEKGKRLRA